MEEYIIGRSGNQPFNIVAEGVSNEHARITIQDGQWTLEDLKGPNGNGTFVRNDDGEFVRVSKCRITPDTIIRLAQHGHYSCTFMARRVLNKNPKDLSYEFDAVCRLADDLYDKVDKLEQTWTTHQWIQVFAPIVAFGVSCLPLPIFDAYPILARALIALSSSLVNFLFMGDRAKAKRFLTLSKKILVCPNCGRPMSDYDIENRTCPACKAK